MKNVAIIIPVFNVEETIEKTLVNLMDQTYESYRIILSENYSTDRTMQIISSYAENIKIISPPYHLLAEDHGNFLLEYIENLENIEYVALYHGDDIYDKTIIDIQVNFLNNNKDVPLVFTDALIVDENYNTIGWSISKPKKDFINKYNLEDVLYGMVSSTVTCLCPTVMIRTDVLKKNKKYRFDSSLFSKAADYGLWLEIISDYNCVGIIHKPLVKYRKSAKSDSAQVYYSLDESPGFKVIRKYIGTDGDYRYKGWRWSAHIKRLEVQDYFRRLKNKNKNGDIHTDLIKPKYSAPYILISFSSLSGIYNLLNLIALDCISLLVVFPKLRINLINIILNTENIIIITREIRYNLKIRFKDLPVKSCKDYFNKKIIK